MKLYCVQGGPPTISVLQTLELLGVKCELVEVDLTKGEHVSENFAKINPQKEVPALEDDEFCLSESNAIIQYLVEKYAKDDKLYPKDLKTRAIVNQRLCFNLSSYYRHVCDYSILPMFRPNYSITPTIRQNLEKALNSFNTYLSTSGTKYAAADHLTLADVQLATTTMCLEIVDYDMSKYSSISKWYGTYKSENPKLAAILEDGLKILKTFYKGHAK